MLSATARGALCVLLLTCSNIFMNCAWYLHLKVKSWILIKAIVLSWLIAFFKYCLQVPANRLGHYEQGGPLRAPQLKILQEFISLATFSIFSVAVLKERLRWTDTAAFGLILCGVVVGLAGKAPSMHDTPEPGVEHGRRMLQLPELPGWGWAKEQHHAGYAYSPMAEADSHTAGDDAGLNTVAQGTPQLEPGRRASELLDAEAHADAGSVEQSGPHHRASSIQENLPGVRTNVAQGISAEARAG